MTQSWEEIDHTADWALHVWGDDMRSLFENAARGMLALIGGEAPPGEAVFHRAIEINAPDLETLLVDWLTALLVLIEEDNAVLMQVDVRQVADFQLTARVEGQTGGTFTKHIKAVTYHQLAIRQTTQRFETTIVFDV